ncbi:hypothetical protein [Epilithonimonas sp.]|uniref:hypothetical protein n=1 Tax=Epilithonimonas sp. TaxID=2894511 RepID=UPI0028A0E501|nr:hypothetical protein [Epilithonimonas sp.]
MSKDLHYSILDFFHTAIENHQDVESIEDISNSEHYIFKLKRKNGKRDVTVLLSDAYYYGHIDFYSRPSELTNGGFILVARPESQFANDDQIDYEEEGILIGKIGILMGALRHDEFWKYKRPKKKK